MIKELATRSGSQPFENGSQGAKAIPRTISANVQEPNTAATPPSSPILDSEQDVFNDKCRLGYALRESVAKEAATQAKSQSDNPSQPEADLRVGGDNSLSRPKTFWGDGHPHQHRTRQPGRDRDRERDRDRVPQCGVRHIEPALTVSVDGVGLTGRRPGPHCRKPPRSRSPHGSHDQARRGHDFPPIKIQGDWLADHQTPERHPRRSGGTMRTKLSTNPHHGGREPQLDRGTRADPASSTRLGSSPADPGTTASALSFSVLQDLVLQMRFQAHCLFDPLPHRPTKAADRVTAHLSKRGIENGSMLQSRQEIDGQETGTAEVRSQDVHTLAGDCHLGKFYHCAVGPHP